MYTMVSPVSVNSIKISAATCLDSRYGLGEHFENLHILIPPPRSRIEHSLIHPSHNINGWCGGVIRLVFFRRFLALKKVEVEKIDRHLF